MFHYKPATQSSSNDASASEENWTCQGPDVNSDGSSSRQAARLMIDHVPPSPPLPLSSSSVLPARTRVCVYAHGWRMCGHLSAPVNQ